MHELVTKESPSLSPASPTAARLRGVACDTVLSYLDEAVDDLSELRFLIDDLSQTPVPESVSAVDLCGLDWLHTNFKRSIQLIAARQKRQLDLIEKAKRWATAAQLAALLDEARSEYIALKSSLRVAYRHRGIMLCASDWQSPSYSSSIEINANRLSAGIAEHVLDYKRDGHLDAQAYEQAFVEQYVQHLGSDQVQAYLANSGMGAFSTVLHWLAHEACLTESVLAVQPMYFENLHLSRGFFPDMQQIQAPTRQELLHRLNSQMPSIVLCDAVTNCGDMIAHEIECILTWAATKTVERTAIVIDTTCVPLALLPAGLLQELPEHVSVIFVESLAKHHQFGMDTVTGGIVVAHMSKDNQNSFAKSRARLGNNISDGSVGSLPQPDRQKLIRRMQRHSRNVAAIARACEQMSSEQAGVLQSVSWVREGSAGAPWFHGSCLTLQLRKGYRSIEAYRQFEQTVLEFAKECGHPIAFGTSFGFDVSRLYVTAPSTRFEEPFLRISIGTETTAELLAFIEILRRTNVDVRHDEDFSPPRIAPTKEANEPALEAQPSVNAPLKQVSTDEKPNIASTVYLGEAGLQNYLNPANYPATPLIELPDDLNPFRQDGVRLLAKMVPLVPLMNIKSLPAFSMLSKAFERGDLAGVTKVIESSSSNTVLSLSVMAKMFGIDTTCAIVDHSIAPSLMRMLRLFGIEIFQHPAAGHELFGVLPPRSDRAATMGSQPGWTNPGQYTNPDNPEGFARWLAPDLWAQTEGRLAVLACGLGTCGTMVGVSRGLRQRNPDIEVIACCPAAGHAVPGPREQSLLADVTFDWQQVANARMELTAEESFAASIKLLRRGIMGGPSSGMNYRGALRYFEQEKASGRLAARVAAKGEVWCTFLCCDSPLPHVDEYFDALGDDYFPEVHPVPQATATQPTTPLSTHRINQPILHHAH